MEGEPHEESGFLLGVDRKRLSANVLAVALHPFRLFSSSSVVLKRGKLFVCGHGSGSVCFHSTLNT